MIAQLVKNLPAMQETSVQFLGQEDSLERERLTTPVFSGFPCGSAGKESICNAGDLGLIPGLGRYPGEGNGYPLQYSGQENSLDCIVHGVAKSWTERLSLSPYCLLVVIGFFPKCLKVPCLNIHSAEFSVVNVKLSFCSIRILCPF